MSNIRATIKSSMTEGLPLALAISAYGLSYGVLATQVQFSVLMTVAMSAVVFSGSVQMIAIAMLATGATFSSIILTAFLLNLRNLLYGAALSEGIAPVKRKWRLLLAFGVSDEPFVLGSARFQKVGPDPLYFGCIVLLFVISWVASSFVGAMIGGQIDPVKWGLDLAFPVTFTALLISSLKGKPILSTAFAAIMIGLAMEWLIPGNDLTIIVTGLCAPLVGLYVARRGKHV